jgi:YfiH family protein
VSGSPRVRWAFSDRHGGVSTAPYDSLNLGGHVGDDPDAVASNRARFAASLGLEPDDVHYMRQVHGHRVAHVGAAHPDPGLGVDGTDGCDGTVTSEPGLALAVLVADCVPVLMADDVVGVVAAVHAGRPGVHAGVVERALERMVALGARPDRTVAWLGSAVCGACYEVPEAMREEVAAVVPQAWATSRTGTPALDLRAGLAAQLAANGVRAEVVGPCTRESPDHFSYRRDGTTGRFAGVVWVEE